ncbi:hypothetical protein BT69DRAFT_490354 [Atractiella rhizophila]|nr:hypothetical protein BT69DRAFT_490354 [Atractiella rhizophila]
MDEHTDSAPAPAKRQASPPDGRDGRMIPGVKRPRTSKACNQCRKQKTRCEVDVSDQHLTEGVRCHRCKVLSIPCSFLDLYSPPSHSSSYKPRGPKRPTHPPGLQTQHHSPPTVTLNGSPTTAIERPIHR